MTTPIRSLTTSRRLMSRLTFVLVAGCSSTTQQPAAPAQASVAPITVPEAMLRVQGSQLVDGRGRPVVLRGVAFGNQVWDHIAVPDTHHSEQDYGRVAAMGMNSVRFYLAAETFIDPAHPGAYREAGWRWLDQNIAWARKRGIYLVLNLHVPPGGYQSGGEGKALWNNPDEQQRFLDLWVEIARRYRGEATVAGYGLLNEPVVTERIDQWKALAERAIAKIREVDPEHVLFVERVCAVGGDWGENENRNFFRVGDPNVVYEFHFYKPFHFTHQNASWTKDSAAEMVYPDEKHAAVEWFHLKWEAATHHNPGLPVGDSEWKYYEGVPFKINDAKLQVAQPSLRCANVQGGKAFFDGLKVEVIDAEGQASELDSVNLTSKRGWYFWTKNGSGTAGEEAHGHEDSNSLSITGTSDDAALTSDPLRFRPELGKSYRISGWMKGAKIPVGATCQVALGFFSSRVPVHGVDRGYLAQELDGYLAWGKREGVPLYMGEWGTISNSFEDDRGGLRWVEDMLSLIAEHNLNFAYHDYHEDAFGLYFGHGPLPSPEQANSALIALLTAKLAAPQ